MKRLSETATKFLSILEGSEHGDDSQEQDDSQEMASKSDRQLRAIRSNYGPGSTASLLRPSEASARHRAAYAELQRRRQKRD